MKSFVLFVLLLAAEVLPSDGVYNWTEGCGQRPLAVAPNGSEPSLWNDAEVGAWPWQVSIQTDGDVICGGTIVHPEWVLTAAYCLTLMTCSKRYLVVAGVTVRSQMDHAQIRNITQLQPHPDYDKSILDNDVMLLRMDSPFTFTDYVQPICIPSTGEEFTHCFISGWERFTDGGGITLDRLQDGQVGTLSNVHCPDYLNVESMSENIICASLLPYNVVASQSDLGGPLQCYSADHQRFFQLGVSSFSTSYGKIGVPGIYTQPSKYFMLINETVIMDGTGQTICAGSKSSTSLVPVLLSAVLLLLQVWE